MAAYPLVAELPDHLSAEEWTWAKGSLRHDYWIGTDPKGSQWLVKMSGSFYAHRERAFDCLAQSLGLSCQSCVYVTLAPGCPPPAGAGDEEPCQGALALLPEHDLSCDSSCPLRLLREQPQPEGNDRLRVLQASGIKAATDWFVGDVLGYLCGANERVDVLFTPDHHLFLIDNEQAFSSSPQDPMSFIEAETQDGSISPVAREILLPKCHLMASLSDAQLESFASVPAGYEVNALWDILPRLRRARVAARELAQKLAV